MRYIIGDIHGCFQSLLSLLEKELEIGKEDEVYFVGDYIDRGPESARVLDWLMGRMADGFSFYPIRGNHEQMMLDAAESVSSSQLWLMNGGNSTLRSMNCTLRDIPRKYIDFCHELPYYIELDKAYIVHAGINFLSARPLEDHRSMLWMRPYGKSIYDKADKPVVHGHTPLTRGSIRNQLVSSPKTINIDGGCVFKGHPEMGFLVAFDLDKKAFHFQKCLD